MVSSKNIKISKNINTLNKAVISKNIKYDIWYLALKTPKLASSNQHKPPIVLNNSFILLNK